MIDGYDLPDEAPGRYIALREDRGLAKAYRPNQLPPELTITSDIVEELTSAAYALGRLDGVAGEVEQRNALFSSFVYKEAEQSSQIEGTRVTVSDIRRYEMGSDEIEQLETSEDELDDIREAKNYIQALTEGINYFDEVGRSWENVDQSLLKSIHETLMVGGRTDEDDPLPGEFRYDHDEFVVIKEDESWKNPIRLVPPKPNMARADLDALVEYIQNGGDYPTLIDIALIHYQFETIHPFRDGNGRVGRLLIILLLISGDTLAHPVLYLSSYFRQFRDQYTDLLLNVSEKGVWEEWILFFLTGIRRQAEEAFVRAKLLLVLRDRYKATYATAPTSVSRLTEGLMSKPYFSVNEAAEMIGMTYQSASNAIDQLVADDRVRQFNDQRRNRIFEAIDVTAIIEYDYAQLPEPRDVVDRDTVELPLDIGP